MRPKRPSRMATSNSSCHTSPLESVDGPECPSTIGLLLSPIVIYLSDRKHGKPWLIASGFLIAQAIAVYFARELPGFVAAFSAFGRAPLLRALLGALVIGAITVWSGWRGSAAKWKPASTST